MSRIRELAESLVTSALTEMPEYVGMPGGSPSEPNHPSHETHKVLASLGFTPGMHTRVGHEYYHNQHNLVRAYVHPTNNTADVVAYKEHEANRGTKWGTLEPTNSVDDVKPEHLPATITRLRS